MRTVSQKSNSPIKQNFQSIENKARPLNQMQVWITHGAPQLLASWIVGDRFVMPVIYDS